MTGFHRSIPTEESKFLTVIETARVLGLSESAVRKKVHRGQLPHVKIGSSVLIPRAELNALLLGGGSLG